MSNLPIFRPSFGNRPDQLVGRDETLQEILDGLKSYPGSAERATLLIGQRGMGKTAMLLEIAERAQELDYVVARTTCGDAMVDNLIEVLQRAGSQFVKEDKKPIKGFTRLLRGAHLHRRRPALFRLPRETRDDLRAPCAS